MKGFRAASVLFMLMLGLPMFGCAGFASNIQSGATQEEVEKALGLPREVHRRWMANKETREVWVYHERGSIMKSHLYPDTHVIVFSNGKVVAKNPLNPYAPLKTVKP